MGPSGSEPRSGLDLFHPETGQFTAIVNPAITNASGNTIIAIQGDRQGNLWLGTEDDGVYLFDPQQKTFTRYGHSDKSLSSLGNNMIKCMLTDHKGQLWAGSINGGLNLFNAPSGDFFHYAYEPGNGSSLSQRTISALFEDRQGNLWVGTHRGGINIYSPGMEKFDLYRQEPTSNSLSYNDVKTFCEDSSGNDNIWIGTDGGGLDLFFRNRSAFQHFRNNPFDDKSLGSNAVLDLMRTGAATCGCLPGAAASTSSIKKGNPLPVSRTIRPTLIPSAPTLSRRRLKTMRASSG